MKKILLAMACALLVMGFSSAPSRFTMTTLRSECADGKPVALLKWKALKNATTYRVQRRLIRGGSWSTVSPVLTKTTQFTDRSTAAPGNRYVYRVLATNGTRRVLSNLKRVMVPSCSQAQILSPNPKPYLWGAFVGWEAEAGREFEDRVGAAMDLRATFVHWGNESEFPLYLADSMKGKTLVIFWEAMDYTIDGPNQPRFSYTAILRGDWDAYIRTFAADAKKYGGTVILIPFEEMNGDWYPWSGTANGNTPAEHIASYRYLRKFFADAPNVKFGWAVNSDSVPDTEQNRIAAYYPGDDVVDYVGVDGFNFGSPWMSFEEIYGSALRSLNSYKKPIILFSMASADGPGKAAWITDALTTQLARHPEIAGWIWFNEDKEHDWRVWSDDASLRAFKNAIPR